MKVKKEVKSLCAEFIKEDVGTERWEEINSILQRKYGFTPFSLLALFGKNPTIEYTMENINLVKER